MREEKLKGGEEGRNKRKEGKSSRKEHQEQCEAKGLREREGKANEQRQARRSRWGGGTGL